VKPHRFLDRIAAHDLAPAYGFVRKIAPGRIEASGPIGAPGDLCAIEGGDGPVAAEIVAIDPERVVLLPLSTDADIAPNARVVARGMRALAPVGNGFAGRAIDALAQPIDGGIPIVADVHAPLAGSVPRPLDRADPSRVLETGIRAIDGLLTLGIGQRVGVFAASGVGKTSLIEQLVAQVAADRCILCLVGERGREVESAWRTLAARPDAKRFTLIASTSDESAALRVRSVQQALALAEHWRARGEHVVLMVDSITRVAMALREAGLAAGAPPTVRAYTPNVFAALPRLVERCGALAEGGAITAIMTVLSETDDVDDPIVELMKSLLDGHIVLSRGLAEQGHFPAIDVPRSVSRRAERLVSPDHAKTTRAAAAALSIYDEARVMIDSGVYKAGGNAAIDRAIALRPALTAFLRQSRDERNTLAQTIAELAGLAGSAAA